MLDLGEATLIVIPTHNNIISMTCWFPKLTRAAGGRVAWGLAASKESIRAHEGDTERAASVG